METAANGAIAAAYFIIPLTLLPLLLTAKRDIWLNLLLLIAFVFSCGVGHTLSAMHLHSTPWHWVTAGASGRRSRHRAGQPARPHAEPELQL